MIEPAVLTILALCPFLRAIRGEFLYDDPFLFLNGPPGPISWRAFYRGHRPVTWVIDHWLWRLFGQGKTGMNPSGTVITQPAWPWHCASLLFHVGTTLAVWGLASTILEPWRAFAAAAIFAVHPLQVSAVAYISGRAGVQAAFFTALGLLHAAAGGWHWLAVPVCQYLAYKSKHDGLLYIALYPVILYVH